MSFRGGIIATGSKYIALSLDSAKLTEAYPEVETEVIEPIRALFRRAIADGSLRPDLSRLPSDRAAGLAPAMARRWRRGRIAWSGDSVGGCL